MELTKKDNMGASRVAKRPEDIVEDPDEKMMEVEVRSTKFLLQTFLQAVKAYRLYEANHPILSKFLDRLERDFESLLRRVRFLFSPSRRSTSSSFEGRSSTRVKM